MKKIIFIMIVLVLVMACTKKEHTTAFDPSADTLSWAPINMNIYITDTGEIKLYWTDRCDQETGFKVYRRINSGSWELLATLPANTIQYIDGAVKVNLLEYRVCAYIGDVNSSAEENSIVFNLISPSNLVLTQINESRIDLRWQDNTNKEKFYRIDRKVDEGEWVLNYATNPADTLHFSDLNVSLGHQYSYRVFARSNLLTSGYVKDTITLGIMAPSNLQLTQINTITVGLSWADNCTFEDGYKVERSLDSLIWQQIASLGADAESYTDGTARTNMVYYRVWAYKGAASSAYAVNLINQNVPNPTNVVITTLTAQSIKLTWDAPAEINRFKIDRKVDNGEWQNIANPTNTPRVYLDNSVNLSHQYSYRVYGLTNLFTSGYGEVIINFNLHEPVNLEVTQANDHEIHLVWEDLTNLESGYRVEKRTNGGNWELVTDMAANSNAYTDEFSKYQTYSYRVYCFYDIYNSDYSNEVQITPTDLDYVPVQNGTFSMGGAADTPEDNELPVHEVTISGFYLSKYEVTQALWSQIMGSNPSEFTGDLQRPVEQISWFDALKFCNKLSIYRGLTPCYSINGVTNPDSWADGFAPECNWAANGYRLPTEAEWEYAAKGGSNQQNFIYSGSNSLDQVGWYNGNAGNTTFPVGLKDVNTIGTYDMSGNVWEWCWDWYGDYTGNAQINPTGPIIGSSRIARGGGLYGYGVDGSWCRNTNRGSDSPGSVNMIVGLRPCRNVN